MFGWFQDALYWAQALDRYSRHDFRQAVVKLEAIKGPRSKASEYLALLGTAHILLDRPDTAIVMLTKAKSGSSPTRASYRAYIHAYCDYYLSVLEGNEGAIVKHLERALRVDAPPIIRQWLPMS